MLDKCWTARLLNELMLCAKPKGFFYGWRQTIHSILGITLLSISILHDIKKKTTRNLPAGDRMALNKTARIKKNKTHITKKEVLIGNNFFCRPAIAQGSWP